jgi:hypothetical protein
VNHIREVAGATKIQKSGSKKIAAEYYVVDPAKQQPHECKNKKIPSALNIREWLMWLLAVWLYVFSFVVYVYLQANTVIALMTRSTFLESFIGCVRCWPIQEWLWWRKDK